MIEFSASEYARLCGIVGILVGYFIAFVESFIAFWISQINNGDDKNEKK